MAKTGPPIDAFTHPDATDAANGLFMLAKGAQASNNQFPGPTSQPAQVHVRADASASMTDPALTGAALGGMQNGGVQDIQMNGNVSDAGQNKSSTRGGGRKRSNAKSTTATSGRRKTEETSKAPANKRQKRANGTFSPESDGMGEPKSSQESGNGGTGNKSKLTDEEKRRNFLERNRYVRHLRLAFC
jgi:ATF/CREB family transcription factor